MAPSAHGEESAYCRKVHARASSDTALLVAPTVRAEALKLPSAIQPNGRIDPIGQSNSYQLRAGLSLSAINIYRGARLSGVADADCAYHEAVYSAQELLGLGLEIGRLPALKSQIAFLDRSQSAWEEIGHKVEERVAAKTILLLNVEDIRARTALLVRRRTQLEGEAARLSSFGIDARAARISSLATKIQSAGMNYERVASHIRSLDAWDFNVTGGLVPPILDASKPDFFGLVQVSWNVGSPFRTAAEGRYLSARDEELKTAKYELGHQLETFKQQAHSARVAAQAELAIVDKNIAALAADRIAVDQTDTAMAFYAGAMLDLERINAESDREYLATWIRELSHVEEN